MLSSLLGLCGTVIGLVRAMPQLLGLLRSKEAFGVSVDTAATSAVVSFGWAVYGLLTGQYFVTLATGSSGLVFLLIALFSLRFGRRLSEVRITPVWLIVLITAGLLEREAGLGWVLPVSVLAANLPQLVVAAREDDLKDLSLGTWLFSMADGLVWGDIPCWNRMFPSCPLPGSSFPPPLPLFSLNSLKRPGEMPADQPERGRQRSPGCKAAV